MGLLDKVKQAPTVERDITKEEAEFIITKLRLSEYRGSEFEIFYKVVKKLSDFIKASK
jgi:hypothetical protein|tara:strand:- start:437 stop:610 length:174 start_codon:yes stop_codon:yes gene_type:complete